MWPFKKKKIIEFWDTAWGRGVAGLLLEKKLEEKRKQNPVGAKRRIEESYYSFAQDCVVVGHEICVRDLVVYNIVATSDGTIYKELFLEKVKQIRSK